MIHTIHVASGKKPWQEVVCVYVGTHQGELVKKKVSFDGLFTLTFGNVPIVHLPTI